MEPSTALTALAGWPAMDATGTPHIPRITCENCDAVPGEMITTEALRGICAHIELTAAVWPAPVLSSAIPCATGCSPPLVPRWLMPKPNVVATVGTSMAAEQNSPTTAAVSWRAPRLRARTPSQEADQQAQMISPGSTMTTRRWLAHG